MPNNGYDANETGLMSESDIMNLLIQYPDLWNEYLRQLSNPDPSGQRVAPLSDILTQSVYTVDPTKDRWYVPGMGYVDPDIQQQLGVQGNQSGETVRTINDVFKDMGVINQVPGLINDLTETTYTSGGQNQNNPANTNYQQELEKQQNEDRSVEQFKNQIDGTDQNQNKAIDDPTKDWKPLFDKSYLRDLFGESMNSVRGLSPYQHQPFAYQPQTPNSVVERTFQDILNTTKAYRGAR